MHDTSLSISKLHNGRTPVSRTCKRPNLNIEEYTFQHARNLTLLAPDRFVLRPDLVYQVIHTDPPQDAFHVVVGRPEYAQPFPASLLSLDYTRRERKHATIDGWIPEGGRRMMLCADG